MSQLTEQGAEEDWRDQSERTSLHDPAYRGHTPVVTRLLKAGWSLEAWTRSGFTPLTLAAWRGHLETARYLLLWGAQIDTQAVNKYTPLHSASRGGHADVVQLLRQCGANQEIKDSDGNTAEDCANNEETRAVFKEFIEKGPTTKNELFNREIEENQYYVVAILAYTFLDLNVNKIIEILKNGSI